MAYSGEFSIDQAVQTFLDRRPALFIDGKWTPSSGTQTIDVHDPATGAVIATVADANVQDVDRAVLSARAAFEDGRWRRLRPADRERVLLRLADIIERHGEELAQLETLEQGKRPAKSWLSTRRFNGDDRAHERTSGHDRREECEAPPPLQRRVQAACAGRVR